MCTCHANRYRLLWCIIVTYHKPQYGALLCVFRNAGDLDGTGSYTPALSFDFEGLECSGVCDITTSTGALDEDSSDGDTSRTMAIAVGSVVSGIGLAALVSGWGTPPSSDVAAVVALAY